MILEEGKLPNCSSPPSSWKEFLVPLVVVTDSRDLKQELAGTLDSVRNHASHQQIFATLLRAMGYLPNKDMPDYAAPLYRRWNRYTVLLGSPEHKGAPFELFDHFPFRVSGQRADVVPALVGSAVRVIQK